MKKKRSLTLLEVVIALALAGVLLSVVFNTYRQITLSQLKLEKAKLEVLSHKIIEQRLMGILSRLSFDKEVSKDKKTEPSPAIYTLALSTSKGPALIMEYENGIDPDPAFCGHVKSELFLSHQSALYLITYAEDGSQRKELLKDSVTGLSFQCFDTTSHQMLPTWDFSHKDPPPILKITLSYASTPPTEFAFFIPEGEKILTFKRGPM